MFLHLNPRRGSPHLCEPDISRSLAALAESLDRRTDLGESRRRHGSGRRTRTASRHDGAVNAPILAGGGFVTTVGVAPADCGVFAVVVTASACIRKGSSRRRSASCSGRVMRCSAGGERILRFRARTYRPATRVCHRLAKRSIIRPEAPSLDRALFQHIRRDGVTARSLARFACGARAVVRTFNFRTAIGRPLWRLAGIVPLTRAATQDPARRSIWML